MLFFNKGNFVTELVVLSGNAKGGVARKLVKCGRAAWEKPGIILATPQRLAQGTSF
jgi:hypothetical protein